MQRIVVADPPMMEEIDAAFKVRGKAIFFSWGDKIYNPAGVPFPKSLVDHEAVHGKRQLQYGTVERWWKEYIANPAFRLEEEIPAHRAEYQWHARQSDAHRQIKGFRSKLDWAELQIARRLSSPLYGSLISLSRARQCITAPS